jgi:hypothetical protein
MSSVTSFEYKNTLKLPNNQLMLWLKSIQQNTIYAEIQIEISKNTLLNNNFNEKHEKQ